MKIISNHPELYLKYRNKRISYSSFVGTVVGYYYNETKLILIIELDRKGYNNINNFRINVPHIILRDYHGNETNDMFSLSESTFISKRVYIIE